LLGPPLFQQRVHDLGFLPSFRGQKTNCTVIESVFWDRLNYPTSETALWNKNANFSISNEKLFSWGLRTKRLCDPTHPLPITMQLMNLQKELVVLQACFKFLL
jgi:hypothetical protein